jgi:hypothetical protein
VDERGEAVAVCNRYGKGQALMIGSLPIREKDFAEDGLSRLAHDFAAQATITRPVILENRAGKEMEAKLLENQGGTGLLVLLNAEDQAVDFCASLEGRRLKSAVNLETGVPGYTSLRATLAAQEAAGIYFEEQEA